MKKHILLSLVTLLLLSATGTTQELRAKDSAGKQQSEKRKKAKAEKKREREKEITIQADASVSASLKAGKHPNYSKLLKSTNYELMYREGLRYFGLKKKNKDYNSSMNYQKAQTLLERAISSSVFLGTPQEDSLAYFYGAAFYKNGDFDVSEQLFDDFRRRFPTSRFIEDVEYMHAMGFYFSSPTPDHDQTNTMKAIIAITEYRNRYPQTAKQEEIETRLEEMRQKLYTKSYQNAKIYYTIGQYKAAVRALNNAIDEYPESPYREELMYLATKSSYLFAKNSIARYMTDRYMKMMDNYYNMVSEFPASKHAKEVEKMKKEASEHIEKSNTVETAPEKEDEYIIGTAQ